MAEPVTLEALEAMLRLDPRRVLLLHDHDSFNDLSVRIAVQLTCLPRGIWAGRWQVLARFERFTDVPDYLNPFRLEPSREKARNEAGRICVGIHGVSGGLPEVGSFGRIDLGDEAGWITEVTGDPAIPPA